MSDHRVFLGILHVFIAIPSFVISVMTTTTIAFSKDLFKWPSYKIMLQINVCSVLHTVSHVGVGIALLVEADCAKMFCKVISCLAWMPGIVTCIVDLTPYLNFFFNPEIAQWDFDVSFSDSFIKIGQIVTFVILPLTFCFYVLIFVFLVKQRGHIITKNPYHQRTALERSVLYVSTLMFLYPLTEEIIFFALRQANIQEFWIGVCAHIMWIALPLYFQIVLLAFNRSVSK
ncbi:hypothetical protein L596_016507 [Steinernema carpocapsae]|uniref:G-protein coupled receptors family 1 profile domain-containing protein n=1 Tax=Steinernema carpocapsae TaxID=34508 RepID=A0A4U5NJ36_STECR|nr:hypothetical protein L596_016507 [Steinernema carpocapsae]